MDHFKSLGLEPSFYLDPDDVQAAFNKLSSSLHPDHFHEAAEMEKLAAHQLYTALNVAAQTLKDPVRRLEYILEISAPKSENSDSSSRFSAPPPDLADTLMEIGMLCQNVDRFLVKKDQALSPMIKVQLFKEGLTWKSELDKWINTVRGMFLKTTLKLKEIPQIQLKNPGLEADHDLLSQLKSFLQRMKSLQRAENQLRERQVRLLF